MYTQTIASRRRTYHTNNEYYLPLEYEKCTTSTMGLINSTLSPELHGIWQYTSVVEAQCKPGYYQLDGQTTFDVECGLEAKWLPFTECTG